MDLDRIHSNIDAFSATLIGGDYNKVVGAYTADARIFPNNVEILEGPTLMKAGREEP